MFITSALCLLSQSCVEENGKLYSLVISFCIFIVNWLTLVEIAMNYDNYLLVVETPMLALNLLDLLNKASTKMICRSFIILKAVSSSVVLRNIYVGVLVYMCRS